MTITVLVPDWTAAELSEFVARRKGLKDYTDKLHGHTVRFSESYGCDIINLTARIETMPDSLHDVPMRSIHLVKHNSPVTTCDGPYVDGTITARVETYIKDGTLQQTIRVTGTNGTTLEELNQWFDDLIAGRKADKNTNPITHSTADTASA